MRYLFSKIFNRTTFVILGWVLLVLAIWYLGPLFAFADWHPLAPVKTRIILILVILAILLIRWIIKLFVSRRINERILNAAIGLRERNKDNQFEGNESIVELKTGFEDALNKLKTVRYADKSSSFWGRLNKKYIYELPWYIFIGAPGSGKTTALVNSGLRFPLLDEFGTKSVKGVGGTRNCDWWFSDETVLLDTAGRYTTHESDAKADKEEWTGFLKLLKKVRPKQPLNGAILTVSIAELLESSEGELEVHAARLRARLQELYSTLGIAFPIYILVTKTDLLGGFNDFFSSLSKEDRKQVWGTTFQYANDRVNNDENLGENLQAELDLLSERLFDQQIELIRHEPDQARRSSIYVFPQNFSSVLPKINTFLQSVFSSHSYAQTALLRGVYFTSGTQEGTPFDRVLSALSKGLGKDRPIVIKPNQGAGKSYFLEGLLRKVIFPEAHLVGRNEQVERRQRRLSLFGHASLALLLVLVVSAWFYSFGNNKGYLKFVGNKVETASSHSKALHTDNTILELLPFLTYIHSLSDGVGFYVEEPPRGYTYGLYQGEKVNSSVQLTYNKALQRTLLPNVVRRLEYLLSISVEYDAELTYEALKAYLMLNDNSNYEADFIKTFIGLDWNRSLPSSVSKEEYEELVLHLNNLFTDKFVASPYPPDEVLIKQVRSKLAGYSFAQRSYNRLKKTLGSEPYSDFNLADAGGPHASRVFARVSGRPVTDGIPFLYTFNGYHEVFLPEVNKVIGRLEKEDEWVLDKQNVSATQGFTDVIDGKSQRDIKRLYLHDYVRIWEEYLTDIKLIESKSMSESIEVARVLSAPDSPLLQFFKAVSRETTLIKQDEKRQDNSSLKNRAVNTVRGATHDLERVFGRVPLTRNSNVEQLERIVDDRFEPIRRLVGLPGGNSQMDSMIKLFSDMYMSLTSIEAGLLQGGGGGNSLSATQRETLRRIKSEAAHLPMPLKSMLDDLADTSTAQAVGSMRRSLVGEMDSSVGQFCRQAVSGRYPFSRQSTQDVTSSDFAKLFSKRGLFQQFFDQHLMHTADLSGANWVLRQPGGVLIPLQSFQQAARIREVFFPSAGVVPELDFKVKVLEMDASITQITLDFDGQVYRYSHGPQLPMNISWPGPRGSNQLRIEVLQGGRVVGYVTKTGPWAPIRLIDSGKTTSVRGSERLETTLDINGKRVVLEIVASSVQNPFTLRELATFSCPRSL